MGLKRKPWNLLLCISLRLLNMLFANKKELPKFDAYASLKNPVASLISKKQLLMSNSLRRSAMCVNFVLLKWTLNLDG